MKKLTNFKNMPKPKFPPLHYSYVIILLIAIVICLIAFEFGDNQKLVEYINFAVAISSLFLGIVAIFYSFITSGGNSASIEINQKLQESIAEKVSELGEVSSFLKSHIGELDKKISDEFIHMKGEVGEIRTGSIQTLELLKQNISSISSEKFIEIENDIQPKDEITKFKELTANNSFSGLVILYCCSLSHVQNKKFSTKKLAQIINEQLGFPDENPVALQKYMKGYLTGLFSANVIDFNEKENYIQVTSKNYHFDEEIIIKRLDEVKEEKGIETNVSALVTSIKIMFKNVRKR